MSRLFLSILNMSLTGSFVIIVICIARQLLKKHPKILSYCLWVVAGIRLTVPFSIESMWSIVPFRAQTIQVDTVITHVPTINIVPPVATYISPVISADASLGVLITTIGALIWLAGTAIMLAYGGVSYVILTYKMSKSIHAQYGNNIFESGSIKSPFVLGFLSPKIYLPVGLSDEGRTHVILHEMIHIRRRDHIVKALAYAILGLHWFNPIVWLAFMLMCKDMEMSCDERVIRQLGAGKARERYSMSLVALATERKFVIGSPLAFGESSIKERVTNVLNFNKASSKVLALAIVLLCVLGAGLLMSRSSRPYTGVQDDSHAEVAADEVDTTVSSVDLGYVASIQDFRYATSEVERLGNELASLSRGTRRASPAQRAIDNTIMENLVAEMEALGYRMQAFLDSMHVTVEDAKEIALYTAGLTAPVSWSQNIDEVDGRVVWRFDFWPPFSYPQVATHYVVIVDTTTGEARLVSAPTLLASSIHTITEDIEFHIPYLRGGMAITIARLEFEPGVSYVFEFTPDDAGGDFFVSISHLFEPVRYFTPTWNIFGPEFSPLWSSFGVGQVGPISIRGHTFIENSVYVYIGLHPMHDTDTVFYDITGRIAVVRDQ